MTSTAQVKREIIIDPEGDLNVQLIKRFGSGDTQRTEILVTMKVTRNVLETNSTFFKTMLAGPFKEASQNEIQGKMADSMYSKDKVDIKQIWIAIQTGRRYLFAIEKLEPWFDKWLKKNGGPQLSMFRLYELRSLRYPCHEFDCAWGFAAVTKRLAYHFNGHITEFNPTDFRNLHLPNRLIGGMNGARGNLRTKLHEGIYLQEDFLESQCDCKVQGLFEFEKALHATGVWPLENKMSGRGKLSISEIIDGLEDFKYTQPEKSNGTITATATCSCSKSRVENKIKEAIKKVWGNFDGLCLDCIDNLKTDDIDKDYWQHVWPFDDSDDERRTERKWDGKCRIKHDQPTWYFSWVARKQTHDAHEKEREERKRIKEERARQQRKGGRA
ncbi:hypothetical protein B7463_g4689, partial [Scytalidium lignicola]